MNRKILIILGIIGLSFLAAALLTFFSYYAVRADIVATACRIEPFWQTWYYIWKPNPPVISNTSRPYIIECGTNAIVVGSDQSLTVNTNIYTVNGMKFHGLLEYHVDSLESYGYFIIAKEGAILWIPKKKKPEIILWPTNQVLFKEH